MTMKPTLQLKLSQHLTLTPQLQQSIRLLQLSTLELNAEVERLLQENPLLEKADEDETPAPPPEFSMEASTATASTESSSRDERDERSAGESSSVIAPPISAASAARRRAGSPRR